MTCGGYGQRSTSSTLSPTNPTKDIEHDVAGLSGSPAISDNLMIATVPHYYLALPETASR
jgi:hypothetical protein